MSFHNVEAEQAVLGMVLVANEAFDLVGDVLRAEHFFEPVHQRIFEICRARITKGHLVSPVVLKSLLESDDGLKALGGTRYLAHMAGVAISPSTAPHYAKIIIQDAARRALHDAASKAQESLSLGSDALEVVSGLQAAFQSLPEAVGDETSYTLGRAAREAADMAMASYRGEQAFLKTGVPALDGIIRGLAPGDLMLLCGATSMGKSALALEIAKNVAFSAQNGTAFVSLEMSRQELATRIASSMSRVPYTDLRDAAAMEQDTFRKWIEAARDSASGKMRIIPNHIRDVPAIFSASRRVAHDFGGKLDLVVIDYAQLIRGSGKSRYEQMTEVSIGLKQLGGMLDCPVIALCQLSREIAHRDDKRPQLSDIKETGQFENDADQVVMCHREGYWLERAGPKQGKDGTISDTAALEWQADVEAQRNLMQLYVQKNRHGRLAMAEVGFHAPTNRFWDLKSREQDL